MSDQAAIGSAHGGGWTEEDWEEYRSLPWLDRRLADIARFVPATERCVVPLIGLHLEFRRRRAYEKAHRELQRKASAPRAYGKEATKTGRSLKR